MLAVVILAAGMLVAIVAHCVDVARLRRRIADLEQRLNDTWARQDRLQKLVLDEGWGDSRLRTRFSWPVPGQRNIPGGVGRS